METIRVNMTPCEDIKTIHASQNDNEAREWEFELHNNGEVIDSGGITDQIIFKAYEGGTEELLPSGLLNGSVDLGSLTWGMESSGRFYSSSISGMKNSGTWNATKFYNDLDYTVQGVQTWVTDDKIIGVYGTSIYIRDSSYASADDLRNALQGVYLWYEKSDSTPTTTPFLGDIKYPQGLLTNQQFTYRESPTEEDGLANIVDIKGQTLKWNQLIASNETVNLNRDSARTYNISTNNTRSVVGHKYCFATTITSDNTSGGLNCRFGLDFNAGKGVGRHFITFTANDANNASIYCYIQSNEESGTALSFGDSVLFDLTLMGLADKTDDEIKQWFADYFPLSYYSYNSGSLIPFMGNGIKTVGKNQFNKDTVVHGHFVNGANISAGNPDLAHSDYISVLANTVYCSNIPNMAGVNKIAFYDIDKNLISFGDKVPTQWTTPSNCAFVRINMREEDVDSVYFNIGTDTTYESYTESLLNLPISTYFPTGMKDVPDGNGGKIYDELTNSKAITRVGSRAYQSGDESDTSVITDGTTTYYALATPTETSFTTASLVTENTEIPLSNEDGVLIGKCTEQLSENPGFIDAKIKLADADGECYSNKIQLHIERSPQ